MEENFEPASYFILDSQILSNKDFNFFDKVVYTVICGFSNNSRNCCFATNEYLVSYLNCSIRSLQRSLQKLKNKGMIQIERKNNSREIYTPMNVAIKLRDKKLEELKNKPKKELIDYDWLNEGLYE